MRASWLVACSAGLAALAGTARADDAARVAVLGLEVTGTVDLESTAAAKRLTGALREQVHGGLHYELAPNSNKDLMDEKITAGCDSEAVDCMAKIATRLGANRLVYGRIQKQAKDGEAGYQLELKLLSVDQRAVHPVRVWIAEDDLAGAALERAVTGAYEELARFEPQAAIVTLPRLVTPPRRAPRGNPAWRPVAYTSAAAMVVSGAVYVYAWRQLVATDYGKKCRQLPNDTFTPDSPGECANGNRNKILTWTTGPIALGALGLGIWATYKGFVARREGTEQPATVGRSTRKHRTLTVTPIVSPDGAGATVRFDW